MSKIKLEESGAARVLDILRGVVPSIHTFAILTAENPNAKKMSSAFNKNANNTLEKELRDGLYGFQHCKGQYGNSENSYFIPNISRQKAIKIGRDYEQESIVWGEKTYTTQNNIVYNGMNIQLILTSKDEFGTVIGERDIFINKQDAKDYFTIVKGRKFNISFFDEEMNGVQWKNGSGVIQNKGNIPEWYINKMEQLSETVLKQEEKNLGHNSYNNRGILLRELRRYSQGLYENKENIKFFGYADGYFTGDLKF
jgi:hypothetical protein